MNPKTLIKNLIKPLEEMNNKLCAVLVVLTEQVAQLNNILDMLVELPAGDVPVDDPVRISTRGRAKRVKSQS